MGSAKHKKSGMKLFERWSSALDALKSQGRFRSFIQPAGIDLTSNDYLGRGAINQRAHRDHYQSAHSGISSRLLRGNHPIWEEVESALASWHNSPAVLMMSSGYSANEGLISTIIEPGDWVAADELVHACIVDGLRLSRCRRFSYKHNDLANLEEGLRAEAEKGDLERQRFVITESLFSMDGDRADLAAIAKLAQTYSAHLIVDEAHSTGCYHANGSGCVDAAGIRDSVLASVHTGGKALGVHGAYICGSPLLKDYLINRCRHLIFTTALPPELGTWWLEMLGDVQGDRASRQALHENAALFRSELAKLGIPALGDTYVVPVVLGEDPKAVSVARQLQQTGYDIRAIRPPSVPPGTARLRISIHADHDPNMLREVAGKLASALGVD
jgi:8-amino-7-oxononanoate synthase